MTIAGKPFAGICVSTAVFACGAVGFPVAPQELPPSTGELVLDVRNEGPLDLAPGAELTLSGGGFADHAAVTVAIYSSPTDLASVVSDNEGEIDAVVALPEDLRGEHTVAAIGNGPQGELVSLQAAVSIKAAPTAATGETLPRTGLSLAVMAIGGMGMLLAGFVLVRTVAFRRKFLPS